MSTAPMSEAELLARLRAISRSMTMEYGPMELVCRWVFDDREALALLASWRDEAVRAERDRKPQIAYALFRPTGEIVIGCIASNELGARLFLYQAHGGTEEQAEAAGWRICRVRIEIDD